MSRLEKKIEVVRQLLCEHSEFTPFSAFKSLDTRSFNRICADDLQAFLSAHNSTLSFDHCTFFVSLFDRDADNELSYDEFLDAILPQDNNGLRQHALSKESDVSSFDSLDLEIQYTLVKLIEWCTKGVTDIESEKVAFVGSNLALQNEERIAFLNECFCEIDVERRGFLTPRQVDTFFEANSQQIYTEEIEAFFRRASSTSQRIDMLSKIDFITALDFVRSHTSAPPQNGSNNNNSSYAHFNTHQNQSSSMNNTMTSYPTTPFDTKKNTSNHSHNNSYTYNNNNNNSNNSCNNISSFQLNSNGNQLYSTQQPLTPSCQQLNLKQNPQAATRSQQKSGSNRKLSFHSSTIHKGEKEKENNLNSSSTSKPSLQQQQYIVPSFESQTSRSNGSASFMSRETKKQQQLRHLDNTTTTNNNENHYDLGKLRVQEEIERIRLIRELSNSSKSRRNSSSLSAGRRATIDKIHSSNSSTTQPKNFIQRNKANVRNGAGDMKSRNKNMRVNNTVNTSSSNHVDSLSVAAGNKKNSSSLGSISPSPSFNNLSQRINPAAEISPIQQDYYVRSFAKTSVSPFKVASEQDRRDHTDFTATRKQQQQQQKQQIFQQQQLPQPQKLTSQQLQQQPQSTSQQMQNRGRLSTKQGVLDFKQDIRGRLATSKLVRDSQSPPANSTLNASSSSQNFLDTSNTIRKYSSLLPGRLKQKPDSAAAAAVESSLSSSQYNQVQLQHFQTSSPLRMRQYFEITKGKSKKKSKAPVAVADNSISNLPLRSFPAVAAAVPASNTLLTGEDEIMYPSIVKVVATSRRLDLNSAKEMPVRNLRQNIAFNLRNYCMNGAVMNSRRSEPLKHALQAREDYNLFQLFELLDRSQRGQISAYDIHLFFASQSIPVSLIDISLFVRRLDKLDVDLIRFSTFAQTLTPASQLLLQSQQQQEQSSLQYEAAGTHYHRIQQSCTQQKQPMSQSSKTQQQSATTTACGLKDFSPESVVSRDTMKGFSALLFELIAAERRLEDLRQEIFKERKWDYFYAFQVLDVLKKGYVDQIQIAEFIEESGEYQVGREDVDAVLNVFSVERGDVLREDRFIAELQPKALP